MKTETLVLLGVVAVAGVYLLTRRHAPPPPSGAVAVRPGYSPSPAAPALPAGANTDVALIAGGASVLSSIGPSLISGLLGDDSGDE